jgi:CRISPR-associated endonuclease/helicase Cas3
MGDVLPIWFPIAFERGGPVLPEYTAFEHLVCGLTTLADWLGSDVRWFS